MVCENVLGPVNVLYLAVSADYIGVYMYKNCLCTFTYFIVCKLYLDFKKFKKVIKVIIL